MKTRVSIFVDKDTQKSPEYFLSSGLVFNIDFELHPLPSGAVESLKKESAY